MLDKRLVWWLSFCWQVFKGQQSNMNNMVRVLLKRGLVTDLARIPHSIDLTSPHMATTVNAALKPLETLSRIVNQPQAVLSKTKPKTTPTLHATQGVVDETAANNPPTGELANTNSPCTLKALLPGVKRQIPGVKISAHVIQL